MYADPKFIKKHSYKINFNDVEAELIESIARYTGEQPSALIRKMTMEQAELMLALEEDDKRRSA